MAYLDANEIEKLLEQIAGLKITIDSGSEEGRESLKRLNVDVVLKGLPHTKEDEPVFDKTAWAALNEKTRTKKYKPVGIIRDRMYELAGLDGPRDPGHIMHSTFPSNGIIVTAISLSALLTIGLLICIIVLWRDATGPDLGTKTKTATSARKEYTLAQKTYNGSNAELTKLQLDPSIAEDEEKNERKENLDKARQTALDDRTTMEKAEDKANLAAAKFVDATVKGGATERSVLGMVILLGALGGSLHLLRSVVMYVGDRKLKRSWIFYYFAVPITGAGLAPIVYMLLRVGVLTPSGDSGSGSAIANLNLIGIYAFAALTGLFTKIALDKLNEVFSTMFRTKGEPKPSDPIEEPSASVST